LILNSLEVFVQANDFLCNRTENRGYCAKPCVGASWALQKIAFSGRGFCARRVFAQKPTMADRKGRTPNRSDPVPLEITLPAHTHAYLVKLATAGALGRNEALIAAQIVVQEVERLIAGGRAEERP
jgi:hypothetical protein